MATKMCLVENTMEETIDLMVGRIGEATKEITETLAGTIDIRIATEIIITIAATHQDRIENHSITDTESPSTECLIIGVTMGATHRNSTGTQITVSTDTENKNRCTEHPTIIGAISTGLCRITIRGIISTYSE